MRVQYSEQCEQVLWNDKPTNFTGRNGYMKCGGVDLLLCPASPDETALSFLVITALTSRSAPGRCDIVVPVSQLSQLIAALQSLEANLTTTAVTKGG